MDFKIDLNYDLCFGLSSFERGFISSNIIIL